SGASGDFVIMARIKLSQAQRLALAGPIDRKGIPAAGGKFEAVEQHAHLLAVVHAIEDDDGRRPTRSTLCFHEDRRQRRILEWNLDKLDIAIAPLESCALTLQ